MHGKRVAWEGEGKTETDLNSANNLTHVSFLTAFAFAAAPSLPFNPSSSTNASRKHSTLMGSESGNVTVLDRDSRVEEEREGVPRE